MWTYSIKCSKCGKGTVGAAIWGRFNYQLPDGGLYPLHRSLGWCFSCNDFEAVEDLDPEARLGRLRYHQTQVAQAQTRLDKIAGRSDLVKLLSPRLEERQRLETCIQRGKKEIQSIESFEELFKKLRTSEERCLKCGSSRIVKPILPEPGRGQATLSMNHPPCGGRLLMQGDAMSISMDFTHERIYSLQGQLLEQREITKQPTALVSSL